MKKLLLFISAILVMSFMTNAQETITYNFDDGSMMGWTSLDADGDGYGWVMGSATAEVYLVAGASLAGEGHNASPDMVCSGSYTNFTSQVLYPNNYLLSPDKGAYSQISFYACGQDSGYPSEHFGVAVSTESTPQNFTMIQEWTLSAKSSGVKSYGRGGQTRDQGSWYQFTADLSEYAGQDIWVAIRHFNCSDEFILDVDDITLTIAEAPAGEVIEINFENGDIHSFINDVTYPWYLAEADNGSQYCIKSGNAGEHGTTSAISMTKQYLGTGTISFDAALWGEGSSSVWDKCEFYIDETMMFQYGALQRWEHFEYPVTAGEHTFTWRYSKDNSVNPEGDFMAVDNIKLVGVAPTVCVAPTTVNVELVGNKVVLTWDGEADSYTIRVTQDDVVIGTPYQVTENTYTIENLPTAGEFLVEVQADCDPENWASATFTYIINISNVKVNGYTPAVWGQYPDFDLEVAADVHYTVADVKWQWSDETNSGYLTPYDVFNNEAVTYTMIATIETYPGYVFTNNLNVKINGTDYAVDFDNSTLIDQTHYELHAKGCRVEDITGAYYYDFEDSSLQGWTNIDADGDGYMWLIGSDFYSNTGYGRNGSLSCVLSQSFSNNGDVVLYPDNYFVCPNKAGYTEIRFWACGQDANWANEHFGVAVSTNGNTDAADFTTIAEWTLTAKEQGNWYEFTVNFNDYPEIAGQEMWVAIRHFNVSDQFNINVDDIAMFTNASIGEHTMAPITLYPNPAKDVVYLEGAEDEMVSVYDATGRLVMQQVYNGQLNVSTLEKGLYAVTTGKRTARFVKE